MNIFVVDEDPVLAAQMLCDKHVVKMILESAQMLCTAHRVQDSSIISDDVYDAFGFYKKTHVNHPCNKWVRESPENYIWLYNHFSALVDEHEYRFNPQRRHLSWSKLHRFLRVLPLCSDNESTPTPFVQCMPDCYKGIITTESYRNYYRNEKRDIAKWTKRNKPDWF